LISPLTYQWVPAQQAVAVKRLVSVMQGQLEDAAAVLGLPTADNSSTWTWPMRKLRLQHWKLQYSMYPTGYARRLLAGPGMAQCFGGDATSGTRVYRSSALSELLSALDGDAAWLVNLDLQGFISGLHKRTFVCLFGVLHEEDYRTQADLTDALALRYDIEAAIFGPGLPLRVNCQVTFRNQDRMYDLVQGGGLSAPYCFRQGLREAWRSMAAWWRSLDEQRNFLVAIKGTALTMLRNSASLMPWDCDVDSMLFTDGPRLQPTANELLNETLRDSGSLPEALAELRRLGFNWTVNGDYRQRGAGLHVELRYTGYSMRPGPFTVFLDAVFRDHQELLRFPFVANLAGVEVRFCADQQDLLHSHYGKPNAPSKMLRPGGLFQGIAQQSSPIFCRQEGHNACLIDCRFAR